jgi:hypothetical protein
MPKNLTAEIEVEDLERLVECSVTFFEKNIESINLKMSKITGSDSIDLLNTNLSFREDIVEKVFDTLLSVYPKSSSGVSIQIGINLWLQNAAKEILDFLEIEIALASESLSYTFKFNGNVSYTDSNRPLTLAHSQVPLDSQLILRLLEQICIDAEPQSLYLYSGERQLAPWNYHLIFHRSPEDHIADINKFLKTHQPEKTVEPSEASATSPIRDSVEALSKIQKVFNCLYTKFFKFNLPTAITLAELAQIWAESQDVPFKTFEAGQGIGVYATPFLESNCEVPYWQLIRHVVVSAKLGWMTEQILDELLAPPPVEPADSAEVPAETKAEKEVATLPAPPQPLPTLPVGLSLTQQVDVLVRELTTQPHYRFVTRLNAGLGDQVVINPLLDRWQHAQGLSLDYGPQSSKANLWEFLLRLGAYQNLREQQRLLGLLRMQLQRWFKRQKQLFTHTIAHKMQEQSHQLADALLQQQELWETDRLQSLTATELDALVNQVIPQVQAQHTLCQLLESTPNFGFLEHTILDHKVAFCADHPDSLQQFFDHPDQRSNPHLKKLIPALAEAAETDTPCNLEAAMSQFFAHYYLAQPTPEEPLSLLSLDPTQPLQLKLDSDVQPWQISQSPATSPTQCAQFIITADGLPQISRFEISPQLEQTYRQTLARYHIERPPFAELASDLLLQQVMECLLTSKLYPNRPLVLAPHQSTPYSSLALRWGGVQPQNLTKELLPQVWQVTAARAKEANIWVVVTFGTAGQPLRVIEDGQGARLQEGSRAYVTYVLDQMSTDEDDLAQQVAAQLRKAWELKVLRYFYFRVHVGAESTQIRGVEQWSFSLSS